MSALQLKNDLLKYILNIDDKVILSKVLMYAKETAYQTKTIDVSKIDVSKKTTILAKIKSGAMAIPNFEQTIAAFEESRQDRVLFEQE